MVCRRFDASTAQIAINFFHVLAGPRVDDAERRPAGQLHDGANLFVACGDFAHFQVKVWTIESADDLSCLRDPELRQDIAAYGRCSSSSQREDRGRFQLRNDVAQTQIVRTKVMSPKGYAVGLVDCK